MKITAYANKKTIFTRMCIGEAVTTLLKDTDLKHLKVLEIAKKTGISRMTFYKYYASPQAALEDYLKLIIAEYMEESAKANTTMSFLSYEHILFSLRFFDRYRIFFLTMKKRGLYNVLIDSVNAFSTDHIFADDALSVYKRYSYAGSLLNTFLMWEESGKKDSAEEVAKMIYELYGDK